MRTRSHTCLLILFFACLLTWKAHGQIDLRGRVLGAAPLPYATISLTDAHGVASVTQADSLGRFAFRDRAPGSFTVTAYFPGFSRATFMLPLSRDTSLDILLKPLSGSLRQVTVVGAKPVIIQKNDRTIFDVAQSVTASGASGLELLGKVPGVQVSNSEISVAGKGVAAVMVNGEPVHLSGKALTQYLQSFSAGQIERIELISHPSAAYDAEGGAGLINIVTRKSAGEGFTGEASGSLMRFFFTNPPDYGVSNFGYGDGSLHLSYGAHRWSAYANVNYSQGRELEGYGIDIRFPDKHWAMGDTGDYRHWTVNVLAGGDVKVGKNTSLGVQYNYGYELYSGADHVQVPVYGPGGQRDSTLRTYAVYYPIAFTNALNLHLIHQWKGGGKLTLNADYFNYYRTDRSVLVASNYDGDDKLLPESTVRYVDTTKQNILIYTGKADLELPTPFAKILLGGKLSFIHNYSNIYYYLPDQAPGDIDSVLSNEFTYVENTQALYGSAEKETGRWKLAAGLRLETTQTRGISYFFHEKIDHRYLRLFPSVSISYGAGENHLFSLSYHRRINRPSFWTMNPYKSIMTPYSYVEGNPYLEPEYVTEVELSHTFKKVLTSSVYLHVTDNGFASMTIASPDTSYFHTTPYNFISGRQYGISESVTASHWWWLQTTSELSGYYTNAHSAIPAIQSVHGFGFYVASNNSFLLNKAGTLTAAANFWCQFPQIDHIGRSDTYYKLDLGFGVQALKKRLDLALNGTDLLQSSVPTIHYTVNGLQQTFTNFQVFSNIKLSATWHFGGTAQQKHISTGNEEEKDRLN